MNCAMRKRPTLKEKVYVYEHLLHVIQLHAEVTMNPEKVRELVRRICAWSYAHRRGNGELSDAEQQRMIDKAFYQLSDSS